MANLYVFCIVLNLLLHLDKTFIALTYMIYIYIYINFHHLTCQANTYLLRDVYFASHVLTTIICL